MTIRDIALIAGVSPGTVSRAINGRDGVGPKARKRILKLIEEHGFRANAIAQQLSTGRTHTIGVALPYHASELASHPVHAGLLGGLGDAAETAGYDLMLLGGSSSAGVPRLLDAARRRRVDGVVIPAAFPRDPLVRAGRELDIPAVVIGHRPRGLPWVDSAHDVASYELTKMMVRSGRRRLLFLGPSPAAAAASLRARGFWTAAKELRPSVRSAEEHPVEADPEARREGISRLLAGPRSRRPNGIVCGSDAIALSCLQVCRQLGLEVPAETAVSGFDDSSWSEQSSPPLTTVRAPVGEIAKAATEILFALVEGRPPPRYPVVLPSEVVLRGTMPLVGTPVWAAAPNGRRRPARRG